MKLISQDRNTYILRFDSGEEVVAGLQLFCQKQGITGGWISGLGSSREAVVSYYNLQTKKYEDHILSERLEVTNLCGNVAVMDNGKIVHIHGTFGDSSLNAKTGHVKKLVVSATCEIRLEKLSEISRAKDEKIGLNLLE